MPVQLDSKARRPTSRKHKIAWGAVGSLAIAATGISIAVAHNQDVCEVAATGIKFCPHEDAKMLANQEALESKLKDLTPQSSPGAAGQTTRAQVDLSGTWNGANGFQYEIEQQNGGWVLREYAPGGWLTAEGWGPFDGATWTLSYYVTDGSTGSATLEYDGARLIGEFWNANSGLRATAVLSRA